ncbi:restriction endonuclease subunit S [Romboutsia lituseburensis]|uniref:restriction endonuclease subunit S n=1 Tax=Romboutsia lituseburensis TaxID=1537 RepID=UPI00215A6D8E|nr:restriction endonuclease subunit S [Romboutsia lituseburensis]MCR8744270.1 restriction endonuclease subunit S [Romboutsia lituseburensis]
MSKKLPQGWKEYTLKECTTFLDGLRKPVKEQNRVPGPYPYYGANGIQGSIDSYIFDEELVLLAEDGGHFGSKEKPIAYMIEGKSWVNNHAHVLRANKGIITTKYLCKALSFYNVMKYVTGSTRLKLTKGAAEKIILKVPPLEEQERIVSILERAEGAISKREECNRLLDELVKSRFIEMFGDPVINPKGWEKRKLADECNIVTGNTPSRKVDEYYGDYIEWIKSDNITNAGTYLTTAKEYLSEEGLKVGRSVEANSILMTCIAGSLKCIGNVAIADRMVSFNQQINGIETLDNNVFFMFEQFNLSQAYIQSTINMALKGILSKSQLSELEFIFPPIEVQNEFAIFFKQVDKLKFEMQSSLEELQNNFNSLMQRAFNGEL